MLVLIEQQTKIYVQYKSNIPISSLSHTNLIPALIFHTSEYPHSPMIRHMSEERGISDNQMVDQSIFLQNRNQNISGAQNICHTSDATTLQGYHHITTIVHVPVRNFLHLYLRVQSVQSISTLPCLRSNISTCYGKERSAFFQEKS